MRGSVKPLLDSLLWDIYGKHRKRDDSYINQQINLKKDSITTESINEIKFGDSALIGKSNSKELNKLKIVTLFDMKTLLKLQLQLTNHILERSLIERDKLRRYQKLLCGFVDAIIHIYFYDAHPRMHFSLSPPPPKFKYTSHVTNVKVYNTDRDDLVSTKNFNNIYKANGSNEDYDSNDFSKSTSSLDSNKSKIFPSKSNDFEESEDIEISEECNVIDYSDGSNFVQSDYTININNNSNSDFNSTPRSNIRNYGSLWDNKFNIMHENQEAESFLKDQDKNFNDNSDYIQWLHAMKLVARLPGGVPTEFRRKLWLSLADKYLKSKQVDWSKEEKKCFCEQWHEDDEELSIQIVKDLHRTGSTLCTGPSADINQAKLKRILLGYARFNPEVGYCQGFNMLGALILEVMDKEESESMKVMIYLVEGVLPRGYFFGSMLGLQTDMAVFRELMQIKLPHIAAHLQKLQGPFEKSCEPPLTNVFTMQWFLTMFCTCLPLNSVLRVWDLILIEGNEMLLCTALVLWSLLEEQILNARNADDFYGKMGSFSSDLLNGHLITSNDLIESIIHLGSLPNIQELRYKHRFNVAPTKNSIGLQIYYNDEKSNIDEATNLTNIFGIPWTRRASAVTTKQITDNRDRLALDISLLKKQYDRLRERQRQAHIVLTTACSTARQTTSTPLVSNPVLPVNRLFTGRSSIISQLHGTIPPLRKPSLPTVLPVESLSSKSLLNSLKWRNNDPETMIVRRDSLTWKEIKEEYEAMKHSGSIEILQSQKVRHSTVDRSDSSSYSEESDNDSSCTNSKNSTDDEHDPKPQISNYDIKIIDKSKVDLIELKDISVDKSNITLRERPKSWTPGSEEIPFALMSNDLYLDSGDEKPENNSTKLSHITIKESKHLIIVDGRDAYPCKHNNNKFDGKNIPQLNIDFQEMSYLEGTSIGTPISNRSNYEPITRSSVFGVSEEGVTNEYFERINSAEQNLHYQLLNTGEHIDILPAKTLGVQTYETVKEKIKNNNVEYAFQESSEKSIEKTNPLNFNSEGVLIIEPLDKNRNSIKEKFFTKDQNNLNLPNFHFHSVSEEFLNIQEFKKHNYQKKLSRKILIFENQPIVLSTMHKKDEIVIEKTKTSTINRKNTTDNMEENNIGREDGDGEDNIASTNRLSTTNIDEYNNEHNENEKYLKIIPSTDDLEERFNALQRQNESETDISEKKRKKEPPDQNYTHIVSKDDKNNNEKIIDTNLNNQKNKDNITFSSSSKEQIRRKTLPTTEELEKRFHALEKRFSIASTEHITKDIKQKSPEKKNEKLLNKIVKDPDKNSYNDMKQTKTIKIDNINKRQKGIEDKQCKIAEEKCETINKTILQIENKKKSQTVTSKKTIEEIEKSKPSIESTDVKQNELENENAIKEKILCELNCKSNRTTHKKLSLNGIAKSTDNTDLNGSKEKLCTLKRRSSEPPKSFSTNIEHNIEFSNHKIVSITDEDVDVLRISPKIIEGEYVHEVNESINNTLSLDEKYIKNVSKQPLIPQAPAMPTDNMIEKFIKQVNPHLNHKQHALIEELQSKFKLLASDENIKPSSIKSKRSLKVQPIPNIDADNSKNSNSMSSSYVQLDNYEPFYTGHKIRNVRRFSDLTTRDDLENRLQYLENRLSRKFYKPNNVNSSDVIASSRVQATIVSVTSPISQVHQPQSPHSNNVRFSQDKERNGDVSSVCRLNTNRKNLTGEELIEYTHSGEINEIQSSQPINISINIKMSLNKDGNSDQQMTVDKILTTEVLERRLQILEQQFQQKIKLSKNYNESVRCTCETYDGENYSSTEETIDNKQTELNSDKCEKSREKYENISNQINSEENTNKNLSTYLGKDAMEQNVNSENEDVKNFERNEENLDRRIDDSIEIITTTEEGLTHNGNKNTLVLLLDKESNAMKIRRLTRANTAELEGLVQVLENQLSERNLNKLEDPKLKNNNDVTSLLPKELNEENKQNIADCEQKIIQLSKEIAKFTTKEDKLDINEEARAIHEIENSEVEKRTADCDSNPVKEHLQRKTVYLPSTKELEARFRSLERQIKLLEDVEKIDVEQRLCEIERKIKLQYSLSHETDINKFLELCEMKDKSFINNQGVCEETNNDSKEKVLNNGCKCHHKTEQNPIMEKQSYTNDPIICPIKNVQSCIRSTNMKSSKSNENLNIKTKRNVYIECKKNPIHALEIILGTHPETEKTSRELECRYHNMEQSRSSPSSPCKSLSECRSRSRSRSQSRSPHSTLRRTKSSLKNNWLTYEDDMDYEPPTTEELEARLEALEEKHAFDIKMQRNFKVFNDKLKTVIPPSSTVSFDIDSKSRHLRSLSPYLSDDSGFADKRPANLRSVSPRIIRFIDTDKNTGVNRMVSKSTNVLQMIQDNSNVLQRILGKTISDTNQNMQSNTSSLVTGSPIMSSGLHSLMKETSPLRRVGTHTGTPLCTGENINDRLISIKDTIKSIDNLCDEKPYRTEKCRQYIDSLFSNSKHFLSEKKNSFEEITTRNPQSHISRSRSRERDSTSYSKRKQDTKSKNKNTSEDTRQDLDEYMFG